MDALIDPSLRLGDGGPVYAETLPLGTLDQRLIAEPWNTATAALFILLAWWWWRRRARSGVQDGVLAWALPVLAAGGVGGTIYHGTRSHQLWLMLDVMPIVILVLGSSVVLWHRLYGRRWWWAFGAAIAVLLTVRIAIPARQGIPGHIAILTGYLTFAILLLTPLGLYLRRTAWRGGGWVAMALSCFVLAIICRTLDPSAGTWCGSGLHTLWHLGGLLACHALIAYFFADAMRRSGTGSAAPDADGPRPPSTTGASP